MFSFILYQSVRQTWYQNLGISLTKCGDLVKVSYSLSFSLFIHTMGIHNSFNSVRIK